MQLHDRLTEVGDVFSVQGHLARESYHLGSHTFSLPAGLDYDLVITNAGEGILATGMVYADVVGSCDRCLEEARFHIAGEVDGYFLFEEPVGDESCDEEDDLDYYLVEHDAINLTDPVLAALIMETPFVVLCTPACKGLCPVCGSNLNEEDCGHTQQRERERMDNSPFAVLSQLDLTECDHEAQLDITSHDV